MLRAVAISRRIFCRQRCRTLMSEREDGYYVLTLNGYSQMEDVLAALRVAGKNVL